MNKLEDKLLVKVFLLSGSELLFRQLYRKHTIAVYRLALQLANKDVQGTEDIIQEAWIWAVEKLPGFKWNSSFKTRLSGIVITVAENIYAGINRPLFTSGLLMLNY